MDASGAAIPSARITATNTATGVIYAATASEAGVYRFSDLIPGVYSVKAEATGFGAAVAEGVLIQVATTAALRMELTPAAVATEVVVSAAAPTVESETSQVSTSVSPMQVQELPLSLGGTGALRSPEAFVYLTPGVSGKATAKGGNAGLWSQRINGGQGMSQAILLDGIAVDRQEWHQEFDETAPSVEALQEFTVQASTYSAEYGHTGGGVVSFASKGGTNQFHGKLYDIFRNDKLDSNTWFNNGRIAQAGFTPRAQQLYIRPKDKKNDYGGTFGGPVWIPKIYNGKNRTFFFVSGEQYRQTNGGTPLSTLPTDAQRRGDFSELLGGPTGQINPCDGSAVLRGQIFDSASTRSVGAAQCRSPFPGNIIPASRFSTVARNVIPLLPANTNSGSTLNYAFPVSQPVLNTTYSARVDHVISDRNRITLSYSRRVNESIVGLRSLPMPIDPGHQNLTYTTNYARIIYDYTVSPTMASQLTLGYNRFDSKGQMPTANGGVDWSKKIGITNTSGNDFPRLNFSDPNGYSSLGSSVNNDSIDNGYRINEGMTWIKGKHTVQFGANLSYQTYAPYNFANSQGTYNFSTNQTAPSPNFGPNAGNAFASFLLGEVNNASLTARSMQPQWRQNYYGLYVQDNYKVHPSLVLNLGVRWEIDTPRRELHNRTASFDPTAPNPGADNRPGALVFANADNRSFTNTYFRDFGPRLGFAWSPAKWSGKLAVRGGYGIFYSALFYPDGGNRTLHGFTANSSFNSLDLYTPAFNIDGGYPAYQKPPFLVPTFQNGIGVDYVAPDQNRPGYMQNWSLQVQKELATDLIFNVAYVGSKGTRLNSSMWDINSIPLQNLALGSILTQNITTPTAVATGIKLPFSEYKGTVGQSLRPFPQYQFINSKDLLEHLGFSTYHSLQAQVTRRFHSGLNLMASYTWSKTLTDSDALLQWQLPSTTIQNPFDRANEKAIGNQDVPHTFVVSYIYEIPVGRGRKFASRVPGLVNAVIGGWQIAGVQRYQSGQPIGFGCANAVPYMDTCNRFNYVPGESILANGGQTGSFSPFTPGQNVWLNRAGFSDPNPAPQPNKPYQFGDVSRVTDAVRTMPYFNEDISVAKRFYLMESRYVQFRAEAFNLLNRHVFDAGNASPSAVNFGQVTSTINPPRQVQLTLSVNF